MELLRIIAGPLIGAAIGYCTNLIAVKMLFRPRREIRIFGRRLPLTPGAIPKGKPRLAKAVGTVVEQHLLTREDIESRLLSGKTEQALSGAVENRLDRVIRTELQTLSGWSEAEYTVKRGVLCNRISGEIIATLEASGATETILREVETMLRERAEGTVLKLVVNERTIRQVTEPMKTRLDRTIHERGQDYLTPILEKKLSELDCDTWNSLLRRFDLEPQALTEAVLQGYRALVIQYAERAVSGLRIAEMIERKINDMTVEELERLVLSVMKKELDAIVRLGALIGLVLGLLNLFL